MENLHKQIGLNIQAHFNKTGRNQSMMIKRLGLDVKEFHKVLNGEYCLNFDNVVSKIEWFFRKEENFFHSDNFKLPLSLEEIEGKYDFLSEVERSYKGEQKEEFMESMTILNEFVEMIDVLTAVIEENSDGVVTV